MNIAKRRAASLKGWRTRKRMKVAREKTLGERMIETIENGEALRALENIRWPEYKRRALPLPDFGKVL